VDNGIKTGLLGWLDILGYSSFVENSDLAYAGEIIREVIATAQSSSGERIDSIVADFQAPQEYREKLANVVRETKNSTKWIIFADTIVLALSVPQSEPSSKARLRLATFFEQAKNLTAEFFFAGLPVRGAISFGQFYAHDTLPLFAGKRLVEAHKFADAQQWSGCIFTPACEAALTNKERADEVFAKYGLQYPVSFRWKGCSEITTSSTLTLNWLSGCDWDRFDSVYPEFKELARTQFSMHNKDISGDGVQTKISNTVAFMEHVRNLPA
jgi:hypothetical protein